MSVDLENKVFSIVLYSLFIAIGIMSVLLVIAVMYRLFCTIAQ